MFLVLMYDFDKILYQGLGMYIYFHEFTNQIDPVMERVGYGQGQ